MKGVREVKRNNANFLIVKEELVHKFLKKFVPASKLLI